MQDPGLSGIRQGVREVIYNRLAFASPVGVDSVEKVAVEAGEALRTPLAGQL